MNQSREHTPMPRREEKRYIESRGGKVIREFYKESKVKEEDALSLMAGDYAGYDLLQRVQYPPVGSFVRMIREVPIIAKGRKQKCIEDEMGATHIRMGLKDGVSPRYVLGDVTVGDPSFGFMYVLCKSVQSKNGGTLRETFLKKYFRFKYGRALQADEELNMESLDIEFDPPVFNFTVTYAFN